MKDAMPKNKLKWKKDGTAKCGLFVAIVYHVAEGQAWSWNVGNCFRDPIGYPKQPLESKQAAKRAAESWLSRQVEKMARALRGGK